MMPYVHMVNVLNICFDHFFAVMCFTHVHLKRCTYLESLAVMSHCSQGVCTKQNIVTVAFCKPANHHCKVADQ